MRLMSCLNALLVNQHACKKTYFLSNYLGVAMSTKPYTQMDFVQGPTKEIFVILVSLSMLSLEVRLVLTFLKVLVGNECKNCSNDTMYYIKFVAFYGIQIITILYSI